MKKVSLMLSPIVAVFILLAERVSAHCPLCTAGAGVAGGFAVMLGVSPTVVALFIGGFGISMGMWFARVVKRKYIPGQGFLIIIGSFLLTVIPILPVLGSHIYPVSLMWFGEYGSLFNRTYLLNLSWIASFFGGLIVFYSPMLNKKLREKRNGKGIPFQGVLLTLGFLILAGLVLQFGFGGTVEQGTIEKVLPSEFEKVIENEKVFLLNVHTPYQGEINGTDLILEDWQNVEKHMSDLPGDLDVPIAVYCRSGSMSSEVAEKLKEMGYTVYDLEGGMNAWRNSGRIVNE